MARRTILVADDHAEMLEYVRALLETEFDVVAVVSDGQAALDAAAMLHPDLAVLDVSMPGMSGLDAAARMGALPQPPLTVFLTAYDDSEIVQAARTLGASGYVLKCSMAVDLLPAVRRALGLAPQPAEDPDSGPFPRP